VVPVFRFGQKKKGSQYDIRSSTGQLLSGSSRKYPVQRSRDSPRSSVKPPSITAA
jgi:hypothetical protein